MLIQEIYGTRLYGPGDFGVEVELEQVHNLTPTISAAGNVGIHVTRDGSLRGDGIELVTPVWNRLTDLSLLGDVIRISGGVATWRCGTHVHVNVGPLTPTQYASVLVLYTLLEPWLFEYVQNERIDSIFCVPMYKCSRVVNALGELCATPDKSLRGFIESGNKYQALNFGVTRDKGSIEFRHAPAFTRVNDIQDWVAICRNIVLVGATFDTPHDVYTAWLSQGKDAVLQRVFPTRPNRPSEMNIDTAEDVVASALASSSPASVVDDWSIPEEYDAIAGTRGSALDRRDWLANYSARGLHVNIPRIDNIEEALHADRFEDEDEEIARQQAIEDQEELIDSIRADMRREELVYLEHEQQFYSFLTNMEDRERVRQASELRDPTLLNSDGRLMEGYYIYTAMLDSRQTMHNYGLELSDARSHLEELI